MLNRQSIVVGFLQAGSSGLAAVNVILTAVVLRPEAFGQYIYLVTVSSIVPLFAGLGMEHMLLMEASRERGLTWTYFSHALLVRISSSLVLLAAIALLGWHFAGDLFMPVLLINAGLLLSAFPSPLFSALYRIEGRHMRPWLMAFAGPIGFFAYIAWARGNMLSLERVALAFFLSHVLVLLFFGFDMLRFARLEWNFARLPRDIRRSIVFSVSQVFDYAFGRIDIVLVKLVAGVHAVGIYAVGQRIVSLLQVLPSSFHIVELPEFHRLSVEPAQLAARFLSLRRLLLELGLLLLGIVAINAGPIVSLFFGSDYNPAAGIAACLALASLMMFVNYPYYMLAEAMRLLRERLMARIITFIATVVLVGGGALFAGGIGAAVGITLGQTLFLILLHRLTSSLNGGVRGMEDEFVILAFTMAGGLGALALVVRNSLDWTETTLATLSYLAGWSLGIRKVKRSPTFAMAADGIVYIRRLLTVS